MTKKPIKGFLPDKPAKKRELRDDEPQGLRGKTPLRKPTREDALPRLKLLIFNTPETDRDFIIRRLERVTNALALLATSRPVSQFSSIDEYSIGVTGVAECLLEEVQEALDKLEYYFGKSVGRGFRDRLRYLDEERQELEPEKAEEEVA